MIGATLQNRYRLDSELGRGGMGVVYRAHDTLLDRAVAVKVLSDSGLGTEGRARLLREAQAAAKLNHPNIVSVYDVGGADEAGGAPFIVMELVEGQSLRDAAVMPLADALALARQICAALEHAHASGIIHRDLKPENIVLTKTQTAKLMDFGLARAADAPHLTEEGTIVGTFSYLAPELLMGKSASPQSDLYALGLILDKLMAGRPPFTGDNLLAVISQHLHASVVPPSTYNAALPPALDALLLRLLSKQPEERPASAAEVQEALDHLDAAPAPADDISPIDRIVRGRLVARERELAEASAIWRRAMGGEGQVLLISGEPGIGKTRLVRELMSLVEVSGGRALLGECYAEGGAPYAPIAQIIEAALANSHTPPLPHLVLADLITLAPALCLRFPDVPPNPLLDPQTDQQRVFENVVRFFAALTTHAPVLVVVDDAHWADSGTLALVRHLARRARASKLHLLIAFTYREVELSEARTLNEVLAELNRERLAARIKLARLTRDQTRDLLEAMFAEDITPEFLEGIFRETEGNPFFVEEVCKALIEDGKLYRENGRWRRPSMDEIQVPQSVRVAIETRLAKLPAPTQDALRLAAIIGREFDFDTLRQVGEMDEDALIDALETAERAQLIGEVRDRGRAAFAFAHALIPATLREGVSSLRRQRMHRRVAGAIESLRPDDFEMLAYHWAQGSDEERARIFYTRAGDRALAKYAFPEAEQNYRAALDLGGGESERAHLFTGLANALFEKGQYDQAIQARLEAVRLYRSLNDYEAVTRSYERVSWAAWMAGEHARGLTLCREGLSAVANQPESAALAELLHEAGRQCRANALTEEARGFCERALDLARRFNLPNLQVGTLATLGILADQPLEENIATLTEAVELGESLGPQGWGMALQRARNNLAIFLWVSGDFRGVRPLQERNIEMWRQIGPSLSGEMWALTQLAWVSIELGDFKAAEGILPALREWTQGRSGLIGLFTEWAEALLLRFRGELTEALPRLQALQTTARQAGDLLYLLWACVAVADAAIEHGDYELAETALNEIAAPVDQNVADQYVHARAHYLWCELRLRQGRLDEARQVLAKAHTRDEPLAALARAYLSRAEGKLAAAEKDWPAALAALETAARLEAEMGRRWNRAQVLREWAEAHVGRGESGDAERARELLREAFVEFEAMNVPIYAAMVRGKLESLNRRGH